MLLNIPVARYCQIDVAKRTRGNSGLTKLASVLMVDFCRVLYEDTENKPSSFSTKSISLI